VNLNSILSLNKGWKVWDEVKMLLVICLLKILVHKKKRMRKKLLNILVVLFFYSDGFLGLLGQWFCYANFSQNFLLLGNFFAFILFLGIFFWKEEFF